MGRIDLPDVRRDEDESLDDPARLLRLQRRIRRMKEGDGRNDD